jgi:hypothetical protein
MSRSKPRILAIPITLFCLALAFGYVRNNAENNKQLPRNGWTVGFHPYHAAGFNEVPVRVISVTSKGNKGLTNVELRNRSEKPVTAVKIGWYVSNENGPGTILTRGESPLMGIPNNLNANESLKLNLPPVSLAKILKPVVKRNTLRGDFSVQVVVTEVVYEDGSNWKFSQPDNVARIAVNYAHAMPQCANQTCRWNASIGAYQCVDGTGELCTNQGDQCTSSSCSGGN